MLCNKKGDTNKLYTKSNYVCCCEIIKRKGYFAGLIDDESVLVLSPNANEYCASLFDKHDGTYELYLYRLLSKAEYNYYNKDVSALGKHWSLDTNAKSTAFALVFSKTFSYIPTVNEFTEEILSAINIIKDVGNK